MSQRGPHGAEQDGVRLTAGVQHRFGEGFPVGVDRSAADQVLGELEADRGDPGRAESPTISGPIPSPGSKTIRFAVTSGAPRC